MKIKSMMRRILKAAKSNNPALITLSKQWKPLYDAKVKRGEDPVSCVQFLNEKIISLLIASIAWIAFVVLMECVLQYHRSPTYTFNTWFFETFGCTVLIPLVFILVAYTLLVNDSFKAQNATAFMRSITGAEFLIDIPFEDWFTSKHNNQKCSNPNIATLEELSKWALVIHDMRSVPWKSHDADDAFLIWKSYHTSMRYLFPDLPKEYEYYFPQTQMHN